MNRNKKIGIGLLLLILGVAEFYNWKKGKFKQINPISEIFDFRLIYSPKTGEDLRSLILQNSSYPLKFDFKESKVSENVVLGKQSWSDYAKFNFSENYNCSILLFSAGNRRPRFDGGTVFVNHHWNKAVAAARNGWCYAYFTCNLNMTHGERQISNKNTMSRAFEALNLPKHRRHVAPDYTCLPSLDVYFWKLVGMRQLQIYLTELSSVKQFLFIDDDVLVTAAFPQEYLLKEKNDTLVVTTDRLCDRSITFEWPGWTPLNTGWMFGPVRSKALAVMLREVLELSSTDIDFVGSAIWNYWDTDQGPLTAYIENRFSFDMEEIYWKCKKGLNDSFLPIFKLKALFPESGILNIEIVPQKSIAPVVKPKQFEKYSRLWTNRSPFVHLAPGIPTWKRLAWEEICSTGESYSDLQFACWWTI